jgi:hypothetical protein
MALPERDRVTCGCVCFDASVLTFDILKARKKPGTVAGHHRGVIRGMIDTGNMIHQAGAGVCQENLIYPSKIPIAGPLCWAIQVFAPGPILCHVAAKKYPAQWPGVMSHALETRRVVQRRFTTR